MGGACEVSSSCAPKPGDTEPGLSSRTDCGSCALGKQQLRCQARLHGCGHYVASPAGPAVPGREQRAAGIGAGTVRAARDSIHV